MLLCCDPGVLAIFGAGDGDGELDMHGPAGDVLHTAYLSMARAGIAALEFWDPVSRKWGQSESSTLHLLRCRQAPPPRHQSGKNQPG